MSHSHALTAVRVRYATGQRLSVTDMQADDATATSMRELHVRTLHDAWGIAVGLDVYLDGGVLFVGPGLAYDRLGREIILSRPRIAPRMPAGLADGLYQLVIAVADQDAEIELAWRHVSETRLGLEVPLVAAARANHALLVTSFDFNVRLYAQPLTRPHIAYGLSPREQRWRIWRKGGGEREIGFGLRVDTTAAAFVGIPFYVASLQMNSTSLFVGPANASQVQLYVFGSLANATRTGFTYRIVIAGQAPAGTPAGAAAPPTAADIFRRYHSGNLPFQVAWTGIEPLDSAASADIVTPRREVQGGQ